MCYPAVAAVCANISAGPEGSPPSSLTALSLLAYLFGYHTTLLIAATWNLIGLMVKDLPQGDQGHKCCGILEEAANRSLERRATRREKPQPWIVLKFAVGLTSGIIAYAFYVYVGRFCVPMIRDNDGALGGRSIGSECHLLLSSGRS